MKYLITESNLKSLLDKSFSEYGFKNTVSRFKLSLPQILNIYKDLELPEFDCQDLNELCLLLIEEGFLDIEGIGEEYGVYIVMDDRAQVVFNVVNPMNGNILSGYATPFFDGGCELPIEIDTFSYMNKETSELVEYTYNYSMDVEVRTRFNSFEHIILWLNTKYILYVLKVCEPLFNRVSYLYK